MNSVPAANLTSPTPPEESTPSQSPALPDATEEPILAQASENGVSIVDSRPSSVNGKRKVRSSRPTEENTTKRTKLSSISKDHTPPTARLSDLGGIDACIEQMLEFVAMPLSHPEIYLHTGVQPPRGVLLHGPPGCGKTLLANAIAGVSNDLFYGMRYLNVYSNAGTQCAIHQHLCAVHRVGDVRGV